MLDRSKIDQCRQLEKLSAFLITLISKNLVLKILQVKTTLQGCDQMQGPSATVEGNKVVLKTPVTTLELNEFMDTLPNRRWDKKRMAWTCDRTPATAWRLANFTANDPMGVPVSIECAEEIKSAADAFAASLGTPEAVQPALRRRDLWDHQARGYGFSIRRDATLFDMWMGTGKSAVVVNRVMNAGCKTILIMCPTKVRGVWRREFQKWSPIGVGVLVLDKKSDTVAKKAGKAAKHLQLCRANNQPCVIVINYESAWRSDFEKFALAQQWDAVICDESHKIKNPMGKASKFAAKLTPISKIRLCLSGTPMTHSPLDVFSQFRFLDPGIFGTSWQRFRDRYAIIGALGADHIVGYKNQGELSAKVALLTFQVGKEVLTQLPPLEDKFIEGELDNASETIYEQLERDLCAEAKGGVITASNILVKLMRLQQITSGYCPIEEVDQNGAGTGVQRLTRLNDAKIEMLEDLLDDIPASEPVVVFCRFQEDLDRIKALAEKVGRKYGEVSGRQCDLTQDGTMLPETELLGVQLQSGGAGIDLTRACYVVYYSMCRSLGDYQQSRDRCHRPGQTRATFIYHLVIKGTIDWVIYKALVKRENVINVVVDYLRAGAPHDPDMLLAI